MVNPKKASPRRQILPPSIKIRPVTRRHFPEWFRMRCALWPREAHVGLRRDMTHILRSRREAAFVAIVNDQVVGFIDLRLRDVAEGATTSPVGYLEGWYVKPKYRHQGVGRALVAAGEAWAKRRGATEMGSDTWLHNKHSHRAHKHLGYREVERLVTFHKKLK